MLFDALVPTILTWSSQESVSFTIPPRNLWQCTCSMGVLLRWTLMGERDLLRQEWMSITFVLATFSCRPLSKSHLLAESSAWFSAAVMSAVVWAATNREVSSANSTVTTLWRHDGRLFTNNVKRRGPRTDPCGTPEITIRSSKCSELMAVH